MPQLHETMYGKKLLEADIPSIVRYLSDISKEQKRANQLKEFELETLAKLISVQTKANNLKEEELKAKGII